jgi:hypothetical protein
LFLFPFLPILILSFSNTLWCSQPFSEHRYPYVPEIWEFAIYGKYAKAHLSPVSKPRHINSIFTVNTSILYIYWGRRGRILRFPPTIKHFVQCTYILRCFSSQTMTNGKTNNLILFGSHKTKGPKQDSQNWLWSKLMLNKIFVKQCYWFYLYSIYRISWDFTSMF